MNLNKSSRYGLYAVVLMCEQPERLVTASLVARTFDVSENHVAKVLQTLSRARLVTSVRGQRGGYSLAVDPRKLTMLDVVEALEGPITPACYGCDQYQGGCRHMAACAIRGVLEEIGQQIYYTLKSVTIATLARHGREADRRDLARLGGPRADELPAG